MRVVWQYSANMYPYTQTFANIHREASYEPQQALKQIRG